MKLLAISDVHGSQGASHTVRRAIEDQQPDLVLVAGDITHFGPSEWATGFLNSIPVETLAIPGNCDPPEVVEAIEKSKATSLHRRGVEVGGYFFVGMGGSSPTPFPTLLETGENEISEILDREMRERGVLLTHSPPKGHVDRTFIGTRAGSEAIARAVERYRPVLVVCGHIHEARGIERDEHTLYVNPGKAARGYAAMVELDDGTVDARLLEKIKK